MSRICLIRPPRVVLRNYFTSGEAIPPIGMAYLVSSLEKASFDVTPIDAIGEEIEQYYELIGVPDVVVQGMYLEDIVSRIPKDVLLIGLSCMFSCEWFLYEALSNKIREKFPEVPIVMGGEHATAEAPNILKICKSVDICVSGEGEETLVELAKTFENKTDLSSIKGITYRSGKQIVKNSPRERIQDINAVPRPAWDKIPVRRYHEAGNSMTTINRRAMPIMASRGCPFRCTFCTSPQMWGTDLYLRNPKSVVDEIKYYKQTYDIEHIDFVDIVGVLNRKWVKELLTHLITENLGVTWILGAGTRSEILDEEILGLFKASNVLRIFYAPESGSKTTLKRIDKRVNLEKITKSMKQANRLGIPMRAPLIYGFPGQTLWEAFENLFFSFKLSFIGVDDVVAHAFSAHPGTMLHRELVGTQKIEIDKLIEENRYHVFLKNEFTSRRGGLHSWSSDIPSWTMPWFQYGGMFISYLILFLFHPKKLLKTIDRTFIKKKPLTVVDHVLYSTFFGKRIASNVPQRALSAG